MSILATHEPIEEAAALPGKVLRASPGAVLGLIAFLLVVLLGAIAWRGLAGFSTLAASQQETKAAIVQHVTDSQDDRDFQRKLGIQQCKMLAKLSKSDPDLCEVGR